MFARVVTERVLLTGRLGCGKTTLIKRVVNNLPRGAGGFYTEEIRDGGTRAGFKIVTLDGEEAVFAHVDLTAAAGPDRLGKYGLDLSALERIGVGAVRQAVRARRIVIIDEIGPMEIRSLIFRETVNEALDSEVPLLATIFARPCRLPTRSNRVLM
jgi:nucleoside-triphosphatase